MGVFPDVGNQSLTWRDLGKSQRLEPGIRCTLEPLCNMVSMKVKCVDWCTVAAVAGNSVKILFYDWRWLLVGLDVIYQTRKTVSNHISKQ